MLTLESISMRNFEKIVCILLAAVLLQAFFTFIILHFYRPIVFRGQIISYIQHNHAPFFWNNCLFFLMQHASFSIGVISLFLIGAPIFLLLFLFRSIILFLSSVVFFLFWMTTWSYPGVWTFEFLFPAFFAGCAAFTSFPFYWHTTTLKKRFFGETVFGRNNPFLKIILIVGVSFLLWDVLFLSLAHDISLRKVPLLTSISFALLLFISLKLEPLRNNISPLMIKNKIDKFLVNMKWYELMTMFIGAMLVMQIYADIAVHWFTLSGYKNLLSVYAQSSNAPSFIKKTIAVSMAHASLFMYVQILFEVCLALSCTLLIFRMPMLLLGALFFTQLTVIEFGVPARWPHHPNDPYTWTWELLFVTCMMYLLAFREINYFYQHKNAHQRLLGEPIFGSLPLTARFIIALVSSLFLTAIGLVTRVFGIYYLTISIAAGITFFILMLLLIYLERFK